MILPHYLLVLARINAIVNQPSHVERCPTCQRYQKDFGHEGPCDIAGVKIGSKQSNWQEVNNQSQDWTDDHLVVDFVNLWEDVQDLADNQGAEGDSNDIGVRLMEDKNWPQHDDASLEDRFPNPDQECFGGQHSSLLQARVEDGELHYCRLSTVFVSHEREHREHRVDGRVAHDKISIVNWNRYEVEDDWEDSLNDSNDQATMDNELA